MARRLILAAVCAVLAVSPFVKVDLTGSPTVEESWNVPGDSGGCRPPKILVKKWDGWKCVWDGGL